MDENYQINIKNKSNKKLNNKKMFLILGISICLIISLFLILISLKNERIKPIEYDNTEKFDSTSISDKSFIIDSFSGTKGIVVSNIQYSYNGSKYILHLEVTNNTNKDVDLKKYMVHILDKNRNVISNISGNALGIIPANDKSISVIEFIDNISEIYDLEFVE